MNQTTEDVIEFLNFPESDSGTTPLDAEIAKDPILLRERVTALLDTPQSSPDSRALAESLQGRLGETDWEAVAREMSERVTLAAGFFDPVAAETAKAYLEE